MNIEAFYSLQSNFNREVVALLYPCFTFVWSSVSSYKKDFNLKKEIKGTAKREGAWSQDE